MTHGNEWKCDRCDKNVQATKQISITKAPNILVLHVKRFSYDLRIKKITKVVQFDQSLKLNCIDENNDEYFVFYDLVGVIVHEGSELYSGHYIAYVKVKKIIHHLYLLNLVILIINIFITAYATSTIMTECWLSMVQDE